MDKSKRLLSLDALRGFDMFMIIGGHGVLLYFARLFGCEGFEKHLHHAGWDGFLGWDLIFPLFLFISGVAVPMSIGKKLKSGASKTKILKVTTKRVLLLVLFGIIVNNGINFDFGNLRYASVLGRIGLAYYFAVVIYLYASERYHIFWFAGLLLFYWIAMTFIPVPGIGAGVLTVEGNLAGYIDRLILPGKLYVRNIHDPEGLFGTIPAIGTAMLGIFTGNILISKRTDIKKFYTIIIAGCVLLLAGFLWGMIFPLNKNMWTSSFTLAAGGWSMILMAVFYLIIDVWNYRKWAFFFVVIGMNPITIYLLQAGAVNFKSTARYIFRPLLELSKGTDHYILISALAILAIKWAFLYYLYKKKIFLKV